MSLEGSFGHWTSDLHTSWWFLCRSPVKPPCPCLLWYKTKFKMLSQYKHLNEVIKENRSRGIQEPTLEKSICWAIRIRCRCQARENARKPRHDCTDWSKKDKQDTLCDWLCLLHGVYRVFRCSKLQKPDTQQEKNEKASLLTLYCSWFAHCLVITSSIVNVWIVGYWQRGPVHCVKEIL